MTSCHDAERLIASRVDGETTPADDRALEAHLATCEACAEQFAAEAAIDRQLAARFGRSEAPPTLVARVRRRLETEPVPVPSRAGWLVDALNAAGIVVVGIAALAVMPVGSMTGLVLVAGLIAVGCYPLVLSGLAGDLGPGDTGPADAGPVQPAR